MEQFQTVTQAKQICAICLTTIRKNVVWWHQTECGHFYHHRCWHDYKRRRQAEVGKFAKVKCPLCRQPQIPEGAVLAGFILALEGPDAARRFVEREGPDAARRFAERYR